MADVANELVQLDARVASINSELETLQQDYDSHTAAQAKIVEQRMKLRSEREGLSKLRQSANIKAQIQAQAEAAAKAKADADATTARLAEKEKKLDELIAKAEAAAKEPATP